MLVDLEGEGLIIHHWDTDGICSACLLLEYLNDKNVDNKTPQIGNYYLTKDEINGFSKYDYIIIVDMSLPEENISELANNSKVIIFDHHLGTKIKQVFHHNPVIEGKNPDEHPSASWIINSYLANDVNIYSLLGIVGDHEKKISNNGYFFGLINDFCRQNKLVFDDILRMVYLIDSSYKVGDQRGVEEAPRILLKMKSPNELLENKIWGDNLIKLEKEINDQLNKKFENIDGILFKKIDTKYNIISTVTRQAAWTYKKNVVVLNTGFFEERDQVYVRSNFNIEPMIKRGKDLGYKCGGKKEVLGAIVPKGETENFVEEIMNFLKRILV